MRWPVLVGKDRTQPAKGKWHDWKQEIADHCGAQCVYCAITEGRFGGIRNFHIEHFRPKKKFNKLENDIKNLYLACGICNVLKGDDWPADPLPDHSVAAYPDPWVVDYNTLLSVSPGYQVDATTRSAKYLIERVLLNRAQLILERRLAATLAFLKDFEEWVQSSVPRMTKGEMEKTVEILVELSDVKSTAFTARPYRNSDTKRTEAPKTKPKTKAAKKR